MGASVKIMLSYDYCHFEIAKHTDEDLSDKQINEMRKDVQRLADEAVRQYKTAKEKEQHNRTLEHEREVFLSRVKRAQNTPESDRSPDQKALLKQYQDERWEEQFAFEDYDYEDDEEAYEF